MRDSPPSAHGSRSTLVLTCGLVLMLGFSLLISSRPQQPADGKYHILCSFLPVYVFALNVVGSTPGVEVDLLLDGSTGCPHDYALRLPDVVRVNAADLVIVNGLGAEPFAEKMLARKSRECVLTIADDTQAIRMSAEEEHGGHEGHDEHEHGEYNPHVWASPIQAAREVRTLARKLGQADPVHARAYEANGEAYAARLEALGRRMQEVARGFKGRNIVTFHDAFAYLARDLDLNVVATLAVDPQASLSAARMGELAHILREQHVAAIFYEQAYSADVAKRLAEQTHVPAYPLNPFNYFEGQPDAGSYERVIGENLKTLEQALGG